MDNEDLYLRYYEAIYREVDENIDIRGSALSTLVKICISNHGRLPQAARDKFKDCAPDSYFDYIETVAKNIIQSSN